MSRDVLILRFIDEKEMETMEKFKGEMMGLLSMAVARNQLKEAEMMEELKIEVEKYNKILRRTSKQNQEEISSLTALMSKRITSTLTFFQHIRLSNDSTLQHIKQSALQRIKLAESKLIEVKERYEKNCERLVDRLMEVYSRYHQKVEEQKGKRVRRREEFLELVEGAVEKLKELVEGEESGE